MYFIIFSLPIAVVFAALQVFLCKKYEKKAIRLVPLFITLSIIAALGILYIEPVSAFVARLIDWGLFVLIVCLMFTAMGAVIGTAAGWIIFKIICSKKRDF